MLAARSTCGRAARRRSSACWQLSGTPHAPGCVYVSHHVAQEARRGTTRLGSAGAAAHREGRLCKHLRGGCGYSLRSVVEKLTCIRWNTRAVEWHSSCSGRPVLGNFTCFGRCTSDAHPRRAASLALHCDCSTCPQALHYCCRWAAMARCRTWSMDTCAPKWYVEPHWCTHTLVQSHVYYLQAVPEIAVAWFAAELCRIGAALSACRIMHSDIKVRLLADTLFCYSSPPTA